MPGDERGRPHPKRSTSLALRLFFTSTVWSAIALAAAGVILVALYRQSVERSFDERLDVYLKTLVAGAVAGDGSNNTLREPGDLGDPRFGLPLSGWYWLVRSLKSGVVALSSPSLAGDAIAIPPRTEDGAFIRRGAITGPDGEALRYVERQITLADGSRYSVAVAGDAGEVARDVATFGSRVAMTLAVFGLGLVLTIALQVRVGLRPLERMRKALYAIRSGDATRLEGVFPREIAPVVEELNALIESNGEIVERARTHVGNLAHALKTPLSVILNEARSSDAPIAAKIVEQTEAMQSRLQEDLDRARVAAQRRIIGVATEIGPVTEGLARAMRKIHEAKGLTVSVHYPANARFRGERQDLDEMLGNLMDNACKWARRSVTVTCDLVAAPGDRRMLHFIVDDDGPGLLPAQRSAVLERGKRLDETVPGSGLGLAIVNDLARVYGGRISLAASPAGGLRADLTLPGV
ncbi:sensor histidine kinase [Rhizobiales bacterium Sp-1]|uniref:histidine kinase n=1 Tax=Segnochrobactrum spirostomi TaxID=2608987 RepID=A0A6A7Y1Q3_9HYPH|nr:sensor histidine kinase [Segnochrobactrum spirostomi]